MQTANTNLSEDMCNIIYSDVAPNKELPTGLGLDDGATHLDLYQYQGNIIVVPRGNPEWRSEPWFFKAPISDEEILQDYLAWLQDYKNS